MTTVIRAEGLGKQYLRGLSARRSDTLRDMFTNLLRSPLAAIKEGDLVGVIGRNGANVSINLKLGPPRIITSPKITIGVTNVRGERVFAVGTDIGCTEIPSMEGPSCQHVLKAEMR